METELLLPITKDNIAEAQFMSSSFIDAEIKNRAFLNTLGAEVGADYLSYNGLLNDNLKNIHSVKKVLGKTDIADIILSNIHIDVRVVFDKNTIFIPKSHFEFDIVPDSYMILKFNNNYENFEFLGFVETSEIKFDKSNEDYYFIELADLKAPDTFIDFINNFDGNKEKILSQDEILRGRELSISLSDDDISDNEYKEFLKLLLSSSLLRESVLEYDNFEALAGQVANFMSNNSGNIESDFSSTDEIADNLEETGNDLEISDSIMDFIEPELSSENSIPDSASDSAIELAGLSAENDDSISIDNDTSAQNLSTIESDEQDDSSIDLADANADLSDIAADDLSDLEEPDNNTPTDVEQNTSTEDTDSQDYITADDSEMKLEDLSIEQNNLLSGLGDLSADDLLSLDTPLVTEEHVFQDVDLERIDDHAESKMISGYRGDNIPVSSYEQFNPMLDEGSSGMYDKISQQNNYENSESYDFDDLEEGQLDIDEHDTTEGEFDDLNAEDQVNNFSPDIESALEEDNYSSDNQEPPETPEPEAADEDWKASDETWEADSDENNYSYTDNSQETQNFEGFDDFSNDPDLSDNIEQNFVENNNQDEDISNQEFENYEYEHFDENNLEQNYDFESPETGNEVVITDDVINNSEVIENSTVISNRNFEPGEIFLDINNQVLPDMGDSDIGNLYDNSDLNNNQAGLNNEVRIGKLPQISPKFGAIGLLLIAAIAGIIIFSVSKVMKPEQNVAQTQPQPSSLNPEKNAEADISDDSLNIDRNDVIMEDEKEKIQNTRVKRPRKESEDIQKQDNIAHALKPIPPTAFLSIKKLSWEVPDYISYSSEFRQFFQSSGKSIKAALSSDLLLATDYAYTNVINLSITFSKDGRFKDAKVVSSSGSTQIDKIVLQSVNQTLNLMKAPNSLQNDESTTVILKIYL